MLYLVAYFLHFFLPGLLIIYLLKIRKLVYLLAFSLSYAILVMNLVCLRLAGASVGCFFRLVALETAILLVLAAVKALKNRGRFWASAKRLFIARRADAAVVAALFIVLAAYLLYAGAYTEVPADAWAHLERFQSQIEIQKSGKLAPISSVARLLARQGDHWYFLHTYLCLLTGTTIWRSLMPLTIANTLVFGFGFFSMGLVVFSRHRLPRRNKIFMAALSALFGFVHTGVTVFAYVRYYTFAPAMLNMIIAFTVVALYWLWLDGRWSTVGGAAILVLLSWTMLVVHSQELALAVLAAAALTLVACARLSPTVKHGLASGFAARAWRARGGLLALAAGFLTAFLVLRASRPVQTNYAWLLMRIPSWIPLLRRGFAVNPDVLFFQVIALWGGIVYLLFVFRIGAFRNNDYIVGLMALPVLTVLNPFLVDMALRYNESVVTIMYRIGYILPLPFVAGYLAADALKGLAGGGASGTKRLIGPAALLVALIVPLVPIRVNGNGLWTTRALTLRRVPFGNDFRQWSDLLCFLDAERPSSRVITDAVTGYVINGLTSCRSPVKKFIYSDIQLHVSEEGDRLLCVRGQMPNSGTDWLFVVNERDGAPSETGKASGHWPEDVLRVSAALPANLKQFIASHPECFGKIWEKDRIRVYEIDVESLSEVM